MYFFASFDFSPENKKMLPDKIVRQQ